jgi:universal stress protein E
MRSIRRILVAVKDPTAAALPAVAKAAQLARAFDAELELFHAIDSPVYMDMLGCAAERALAAERTEREQYLQRLERIAARVRLHTRKVTVAADWDYPAYEAIVRRAAHGGADLIVAGSHSGELHGGPLTTLADRELVWLSPLPVLLVRCPRLYRRPTVLAALDPSQAFAKPAELDEDILQLAAFVSGRLRGALHAAHAYVPRTATKVALATAAGMPVTSRRAEQLKTDLELELRSNHVRDCDGHLLGGRPSAALCDLAQRLRADVVVVGAVARSGAWRLLVGSTAERLLFALPCDLLIVKPSQFVSRVPLEDRGARVMTSAALG